MPKIVEHIGEQKNEADSLTVAGIERQLVDGLGEIDQVLEGQRKSFECKLGKVVGRNLGSLEENRRIASLIQLTADRLGALFICPRCGVPSRFRCSQNKTAKTGVFVFSHGKQTHGGFTRIPALKLAKVEGFCATNL